MSNGNEFNQYKRAVNHILKVEGRSLVFNNNIGWLTVSDHAKKLKSDALRVSKTVIKAEAINGNPASVETWQFLSKKYNLH